MTEIETRIIHLRKELDEHNYNYYVLNAPTISDREFDRMMEELSQLEAQHPEYADPTRRPAAWAATSIRLLRRWSTATPCSR